MKFKQHENGMYEVWFTSKELGSVIERVKLIERFKAEEALAASNEVNQVSSESL